MAYQELVKNFGGIRAYMREFAVYGLRSRDEYTGKSGRTYDDSRRRIESWLGDHLTARRSAEGKTLSLSVDTRITGEDPLFKAWKSASFTDGDITLHFHLLDILRTPMTLSEITAGLDKRLTDFPAEALPEESTLRKKLREYEEMGLVRSERVGKSRVWSPVTNIDLTGWQDALDYFSEIAPCGVIGSFLTDRLAHKSERRFSFKHHYITHTLDSDVLLQLFDCLTAEKEAILTIAGQPGGTVAADKGGSTTVMRVVPLRIFISAQSGRQYCMTWHRSRKKLVACRMDAILAVEMGEIATDTGFFKQKLRDAMPYMWGVSTGSGKVERLEEVSFTVEFSPAEEYIYQRLEREKRCGTVERLDKTHARFTARVWDSNEMFPWIRSFLCRITELRFSSPQLDKRFRRDMEAMYRLYGLADEEGGGEG